MEQEIIDKLEEVSQLKESNPKMEEEIEAEFEEVSRLNEQDPKTEYKIKANFEEVSRLKEQKKYDDALAILEQIISQDPKIQNSYLEKGRILGLQSKFLEAIESFNIGIELDPTQAEINLEKMATFIMNKLNQPNINEGEGFLGKKLIESISHFQFEEENPNIENPGFVLNMSYGNLRLIFNYPQQQGDSDHPMILCKAGERMESTPEFSQDKAILFYEAAITLNPFYILAYWGSYNYHLKNKNFAKAHLTIESIFELNKDDQRFQLALGEFYFYFEQISQAIEVFIRYIKNNQQDAFAISMIGTCFGIIDKLEESLDKFKTAMEFDPNNPILYQQKAILLFKMKRFEEAREIVQIGIRVTENDHDLYRTYSMILTQLNRKEEADKAMKKSFELFIHDDNLFETFFEEQENLGKYDDCFDLIQYGLRQKYNSIILIPMQIRILYKKNMHESVEKIIDSAVKEFQKNSKFLLELVNQFQRLGEFSRSEKILDSIDQEGLTNEEIGAFFLLKSQINISYGKNDQARVDFDKYEAYVDKDSSYRYYKTRMNILFQLGDYEESLQTANQAIKNYPEISYFFFKKASILKIQKNYEEAIQIFTYCIEQQEQVIHSYLQRADSYLENKMYESALGDCKELKRLLGNKNTSEDYSEEDIQMFYNKYQKMEEALQKVELIGKDPQPYNLETEENLSKLKQIFKNTAVQLFLKKIQKKKQNNKSSEEEIDQNKASQETTHQNNEEDALQQVQDKINEQIVQQKGIPNSEYKIFFEMVIDLQKKQATLDEVQEKLKEKQQIQEQINKKQFEQQKIQEQEIQDLKKENKQLKDYKIKQNEKNFEVQQKIIDLVKENKELKEDQKKQNNFDVHLEIALTNQKIIQITKEEVTQCHVQMANLEFNLIDAGIVEQIEIKKRIQKFKDEELVESYWRTFYWTIMNIFQAYKALSTNLIKENYKSEKLKLIEENKGVLEEGIKQGFDLFNKKEAFKEVGSVFKELANVIPVVGTLVDIIDKVYKVSIDAGIAYKDKVDKLQFQNKKNSLVIMISSKFDSVEDISQKMLKVSVELAEKKKEFLLGQRSELKEQKSAFQKISKKCQDLYSEFQNWIFGTSVELHNKNSIGSISAVHDVFLLINYLSLHHQLIVENKQPIDQQIIKAVSQNEDFSILPKINAISVEEEKQEVEFSEISIMNKGKQKKINKIQDETLDQASNLSKQENQMPIENKQIEMPVPQSGFSCCTSQKRSCNMF